MFLSELFHNLVGINMVKYVRAAVQEGSIDVLRHLHGNESMRYKDLRDSINKTEPTIAKRLNELLEIRLIERCLVNCGETKRAYVGYKITMLGKGILELMEESNSRIEQHLNSW